MALAEGSPRNLAVHKVYISLDAGSRRALYLTTHL